MKKLLFFLTILASCNMQPMPTFGQTCLPPTSLTFKNGDIAFFPADSVTVYEIFVNSSRIPVSTPVKKDTKYHYYTTGKFANYYSIPNPSRGDTLRVRSFCVYEYWNVAPDGWHIPVTNWSVYQSDPAKFSPFVELIVK